MTQRSIINRLPASWREFAAFLRRPQAGAPIGLRAGWRTVAAMLALNLMGLAVLLVLLPLWQHVTGIDGPNAFKQWPPHYLVPAVVLGAPIIEEWLFRGWLSGRPRALWLLACALGAAGSLALFVPDYARAGLGLLAMMLVAPTGWAVLRKRPAPEWFGQGYPVIFFTSAIAFGLVHVFNYASPGLLHLPMVLPQLWAGLTLGFVRTRVGLPGSMLVHGASNGLVLALAILGGEM